MVIVLVVVQDPLLCVGMVPSQSVDTCQQLVGVCVDLHTYVHRFGVSICVVSPQCMCVIRLASLLNV